MSLESLNLSFGLRWADIALIKQKKGQFFIMVAILYCVILVGVASYVISVISSPPMARVGGAQYTFLDIKAQSIRVVEVSLANLTNGGLSDILSLNLEDWKDSTQSFCAQQGFALDLEYENVLNETTWNQTLSWSKAQVNFTVVLQSGAARINDEFTVQAELYAEVVDVESFNATHLRVSIEVRKENSAPVVSATVNVSALDQYGNATDSTGAYDNGDGTYTAFVLSEVGGEDTEEVFVSVSDSRLIHVTALEEAD